MNHQRHRLLTPVRSLLVTAAAICFASSVSAAPRQHVSGPSHASLSASPLRFVPLEAGSDFEFASLGIDCGLFLSGPNVTYVRRDGAGRESIVLFELLDARVEARALGEDRLESKTHFYRGGDSAGWRTEVENFGAVRCADVYDGVDLLHYGSEGRLEYDFLLDAGADPAVIAWSMSGADALAIDAAGNLVVHTAAGDIVQRAPVAWQVTSEGRRAVAARFELRGECTAGFVVGAYDRCLPLVIDPVVTFSTFLGGSGADQAWDFDVDAQGYSYVAGYTASVNFPHTLPGAMNGFWDMFVGKFDPSAGALVYSTYLSASGSGTSITEYATGIACDAHGHAFVTGRTNATDFPTLNARQPANAGGTDAVVFELDPAGQLVFSTYHGGSSNENGRYDSISRCGRIEVDELGYIYVVGSSNSPDFPLANALDAVVSGSSCAGGCADMFLSKLTPDGQSLVYSTFIGGALPEEPVGLRLDAQHNVYVGGNDGSIVLHEVAADGQSLLFTRQIVNGSDGGHTALKAFDVDGSGRVVLTGVTTSGLYPTTPGSWRPSYTGCFSGTCEEAFVTVLAPSNGPLLASTYVGDPTYNDSGTAVAFDLNGDVIFALRAQRDSGIWHGELWKFDSTLAQQLAVVPVCGRGEVTDMLVDAGNNVRLVGWVWTGSEPASTPGAFQSAAAGNIDVFLSAYDMQSPPPQTAAQPYCFGDSSGGACPCGNAGATGNGCSSSVSLAGAHLAGSGHAGASSGTDTLVLTSTQVPNGPGLYFQGTATVLGTAGAPFGDGLLCVSGSLIRLGVVFAAGSSATYPGGSTQTPIHIAGGNSSGDVRHYQFWYRDAAVFCSTSTFNLTQGVTITWEQ